MGRDDDRELLVLERDDGGGGLKWLLIGAAVGAGLALLFAPSSGRVLRQDLRRGARRARRLAEHAVDDLKGSFGASEEDEAPLHGAGEVYDGDDDEEALEQPTRPERPSLRAARDELERRLAAARARRRRPVPDDDEDEEPVA